MSADWCSSPVCSAEFVRRLRYCEYLGKYFCDCCHSHLESCIPARILTMWDFRKYYVSNFSKRLLDSIWHQPIFNLLNVNYSLYAKAKELGRVRVSSCPFRGESSPVAEKVLWWQMHIQTDAVRGGFTVQWMEFRLQDCSPALAFVKASCQVLYLCIVLHLYVAFELCL